MWIGVVWYGILCFGTMLMSTSLCTLFVVLLVNFASSARYGIPDNRVHQFAGYVGCPVRDNSCGNIPIYLSCGGSLVSIPGFPARRMLVTARHCLSGRTNAADKYVIHFGDNDKRIVNTTCQRTVDFVTTGPTVYKASYAWFPPTPNGNGIVNGVGPGVFGEEYGIVLLDVAVPATQVDKPAMIFDSSSTNALVLPVVGTAGYGIVGFGTRLGGTLGQPLPTQGPRDKMYVEMNVTSIQQTNIIASMNAARLEEALCNGDSGSAAMKPGAVNGVYNIYGVVVAGDFYCRATNTYTRIGTYDFNVWLASIKADVLSKA